MELNGLDPHDAAADGRADGSADFGGPGQRDAEVGALETRGPPKGGALKDRKRRNEARKRAEKYAPRPLSSFLMYGIVGVGLAILALLAFARFYELDPFAYPLWVAAAMLLVFIGSIVLRLVRSRRHAAAHRREYDKAGKP